MARQNGRGSLGVQHGCVRGLQSGGTRLAGTHQEEVLGNWGLGMVGDERMFREDGAAQEVRLMAGDTQKPCSGSSGIRDHRELSAESGWVVVEEDARARLESLVLWETIF